MSTVLLSRVGHTFCGIIKPEFAHLKATYDSSRLSRHAYHVWATNARLFKCLISIKQIKRLTHLKFENAGRQIVRPVHA